MPEAEAGLPIMRQTLCKVGQHVFFRGAFRSAAGSPVYETWSRCHCGLLAWEDRDA